MIHSLPSKWREKFKQNSVDCSSLIDPLPNGDIRIYTEKVNLLLSKVNSKKIYNIFIAKRSCKPTGQKTYERIYEQVFDWNKLYCLPFQCALDTKMREFQFKILHRIVFTNHLLYKIGKVDSPLCSLCQCHDETIEHLFFDCTKVQLFWNDLKGKFDLCSLKYNTFNKIDVILGICDCGEEFRLTNYIILLAKYYIYKCSLGNTLPKIAIFLIKIKAFYEIEFKIATDKNKLQQHFTKWDKLLPLIFPS